MLVELAFSGGEWLIELFFGQDDEAEEEGPRPVPHADYHERPFDGSDIQ